MGTHTFGTFDAKNKLSHLLDLVEQGDEVIITRNGKPVARIVPDISDQLDADKRKKTREAIDQIKKLRESLPKNALEGTSIKELIEAGRRY